MGDKNSTSSRGRARSPRKSERLSQDEVLNQVLHDHKKSVGDVVCIKIDARTSIELSANLSLEDRQKRVDNYIKNMSYKVIK